MKKGGTGPVDVKGYLGDPAYYLETTFDKAFQNLNDSSQPNCYVSKGAKNAQGFVDIQPAAVTKLYLLNRIDYGKWKVN